MKLIALSIFQSTAIKLSGMPSKLYPNAYKAIECILGQQKQVTIKDLAVMFGCISSVTLAEQVLKRLVGWSHPHAFGTLKMTLKPW